MMPEIEMFVSLVIPDNTAITAAAVLRKMGYSKLLNLKREVYYRFSFNGSVRSFTDKIAKVDILVNANKNRVRFKKPGEGFGDRKIRVLVKNTGDSCADVLSTLRNRLGFRNIRKMERGTIWLFAIDDKPENVTPIAWEMARKLFYNRHYQAAEIISRK
jgi:hypothetical protein